MRSLLRRLTIFAVVLLVSGYALLRLSGPNGVTAYLDKLRAIDTLKAKNAELEQDVADLHKQTEGLRAKDSQRELEIRRRLNLVKPNEKLFIFDEGSGQPSPERFHPSSDSPASR